MLVDLPQQGPFDTDLGRRLCSAGGSRVAQGRALSLCFSSASD